MFYCKISFLTIFLSVLLLSCTTLLKDKKTTSVPTTSDCPNYTGAFDCPAMPNIKHPLPAYIMYGTTTNEGGIYTYKSHLSISPNRKSTIISDGNKHTSIDHRGITRDYRATCKKGVLINRYSTSKGMAQTEIWVTKDGHLKIRYDFAEGKILTCKRISD